MTPYFSFYFGCRGAYVGLARMHACAQCICCSLQVGGQPASDDAALLLHAAHPPIGSTAAPAQLRTEAMLMVCPHIIAG
jgi:hypothetical protein